MSLETKVNAVAESLEMMGFKLLAACARTSGDEYIDGYAELTKNFALKQNEMHIAERMSRL